MNGENKTLLVLAAVVIGIILGIFLEQKISGEINVVSSDVKKLETSI